MTHEGKQGIFKAETDPPGVFLSPAIAGNPQTAMANKLVSYLKQSKEELTKVEWPNRKETLHYTLVVLGVSVAIALFLGVIDFGLNKALELIVA